MPSRQPDTAPPDPTRRRILGALAFAVPVAWLAGETVLTPSTALAQVGADAKAPASFMSICRLLTGHPEISDALADSAWSALLTRHPSFAAEFSALEAGIAASGLTAFADFPKSAIVRDPALKATAIALVSVWYLGRVGKIDNMSEDASTFVTFADALMWSPTINETIIPTYARGGPGHWAAPPAGVTPR